MLVTRVNLLALASEGSGRRSRLRAARATEKRRGKALTATHFNRDKASITFSASQTHRRRWRRARRTRPRCRCSWPPSRAPTRRSSRAASTSLVGEERDASVYTASSVVGQEEIETKLGRLQTWRLSRPPKPGSYNSRLDIWLAPGRGWYPVRIRNTEANGAVTTQTVTQDRSHRIGNRT